MDYQHKGHGFVISQNSKGDVTSITIPDLPADDGVIVPGYELTYDEPITLDDAKQWIARTVDLP